MYNYIKKTGGIRWQFDLSLFFSRHDLSYNIKRATRWSKLGIIGHINNHYVKRAIKYIVFLQKEHVLSILTVNVFKK